jgi:uncharacterized lipoprotein
MSGRLILLTVFVVMLGGCGGNQSCEDSQRYQSAQQVGPLVVPDDLDNLQTHKELKIPEVSPRKPRPADAGCLALPPAIPSTSK